MAERPIFIPEERGTPLVKEVSFTFDWSSGFAPSQKKKNVRALHDAAGAQGYSPLLEISTKSDHLLGQRLSSFNLRVHSDELGVMPLECAFQGSKVFEHGGPYTDLYGVDPRSAKNDPRIRNSGQIVQFHFGGLTFPSEPRTAFYDWLYLTALLPHCEFLSRLKRYAGFTDIEFNPSRSLNCQARSCALLVAMMTRDILPSAMQSPMHFIQAITSGSIVSQSQVDPQPMLF